MRVNLHPDQEAFIQRMVESGRFPTASEVVREALRQLAEHHAADPSQSPNSPGDPTIADQADSSTVTNGHVQSSESKA